MMTPLITWRLRSTAGGGGGWPLLWFYCDSTLRSKSLFNFFLFFSFGIFKWTCFCFGAVNINKTIGCNVPTDAASLVSLSLTHVYFGKWQVSLSHLFSLFFFLYQKMFLHISSSLAATFLLALQCRYLTQWQETLKTCALRTLEEAGPPKAVDRISITYDSCQESGWALSAEPNWTELYVNKQR